jgi:hypothetical protein
MFLACCAPCIGLGLLDAAKKARDNQTAAQEDEGDLREKTGTDPRRPYPVGLRKLTFTYHPEEGPARTRKATLWYPTTGEVQPHDYFGLKGFATPDGPLAAGAHLLQAGELGQHPLPRSPR